MHIGEVLHGGRHAGSRDGGLLRRPRLYEVTTAVAFAGRRRRLYDDLVARSGATVGDRVLDVGCGPGYLTRLAADAAGPTGRVVGIDPSPEAVAHARRRARRNTTFRVATAEDLPFPDQTFDVVLCCLALHHVPQDRQPTALDEMRRVLRPGGTLLVADFRAPRTPSGHRRLGAVGGHAPADGTVGLLPDRLSGAGLQVTGQSDHRHRLHSVTATRS